MVGIKNVNHLSVVFTSFWVDYFSELKESTHRINITVLLVIKEKKSYDLSNYSAKVKNQNGTETK